jgi:hypothetical protein
LHRCTSNEVNIFRFPNDFDIARVTRHFAEYGFQHSNYQDTQVYTYTGNETPPWLELVTPNIFNRRASAATERQSVSPLRVRL